MNLAIYGQLEVGAAAATPARTLQTLDAISEARVRIAGNVAPALALEAVLISAIRRREAVAIAEPSARAWPAWARS